jgi:1-deoxy-D-xylulose-5-phosphate synthase
VQHLALPDFFIEHGTRGECLADGGLDVDGLHSRMSDFLRQILPASSVSQ